jgi:hypothetical protein
VMKLRGKGDNPHFFSLSDPLFLWERVQMQRSHNRSTRTIFDKIPGPEPQVVLD